MKSNAESSSPVSPLKRGDGGEGRNEYSVLSTRNGSAKTEREEPMPSNSSNSAVPNSDFRNPHSAIPRSPFRNPQLIDTFGRIHNNLRISVTDRCNLRCVYCMPEEVVFLDRQELLSFEEITHFVRVAAPLGIDKIRLTGGEPLMRRELHRLVRMLAPIPGIRDIGLTTNGLLLAEHAEELFDSGLRRLNISLDTLDPGRFFELSRRDGLDRVIDGMLAAKKAGFHPIKVNAVAIRGYIEHDAVPLARFCREHGFEMRYIEYMPIGAEPWERGKVFFAHELLELLEREISPLSPAEDYDPRAPAMDFVYADGRGRVGMIASVS